jgi:hypothetical protein
MPQVFSTEQEAYGPLHAEHLLAQYKIAVDMAHQTSVHRRLTNTFFVTLNTTLIGAYIFGSGTSLSSSQTGAFVLLAFFGVVLCFVWHSLIHASSTLNSAKYRVICALEERLPARLYSAEWEILDYGVTSRHKTLSKLEKLIPWLVAAIHIGLAGAIVFS